MSLDCPLVLQRSLLVVHTFLPSPLRVYYSLLLLLFHKLQIITELENFTLDATCGLREAALLRGKERPCFAHLILPFRRGQQIIKRRLDDVLLECTEQLLDKLVLSFPTETSQPSPAVVVVSIKITFAATTNELSDPGQFAPEALRENSDHDKKCKKSI